MLTKEQEKLLLKNQSKMVLIHQILTKLYTLSTLQLVCVHNYVLYELDDPKHKLPFHKWFIEAHCSDEKKD